MIAVLFIAWIGNYFVGRFYRAPLKLQTAYAQWAGGDHSTAQRLAWQAYQLNSDLTEAALLAAEIATSREQFGDAIQYASSLTDDHIEHQTRLKAYRLLAHIAHKRTFHLSEAEKYYRLALGLEPDDIEAQTGLANLLGLCGRRAEAVPLILNLVRLGDPSDLLMLLARDDTVVNAPELVEQAMRAHVNDPLPLLAQAWHFADKGEHTEALLHLQDALKIDRRLEPARVLFLKYLAAGGLWDQLRMELSEQQFMSSLANEKTITADQSSLASWADYWLACGQLAEQDSLVPEAIRCYGEAAMRAPDSKLAITRLAFLLNQYGQRDKAEAFEQYAQKLQRLRDAQEQVFFASQAASTERIASMLDAYAEAGRYWEAVGWCRTASNANPVLQTVLAPKLAIYQRQTAAQPLTLVSPEDTPVRYLDLSAYPIPKWFSDGSDATDPLVATHSDSDVKINDTTTELRSNSTISFRNDATTTGLEFRFENGVQDKPQRRMYEFSGGGVAVVDFDNDGRPDLALAQGGPWQKSNVYARSRDALFRNIDGQRYSLIDANVLGSEQFDGFGQGVTMGDVNSDGYADLYMAQIGQNRLLINNGDGTFDEATPLAGIADESWTTSCLIADLTGDGLPDLYDVNYLQGDDLFDRICVDHTGQPAMCMPSDFDAALDRLWINHGDGTFQDGRARLLTEPLGKGLGCLAFRRAETPGLHLLIANDTTPNFLFEPHTNQAGQVEWTDIGVTAGVAFSGAGKAQGCMGIAANDVNRDGQLDFVITNFLNESSTYYASLADGGYRDDSNTTQLSQPTRDVLGFGTQFFDADLDGVAELFMANGHIDDLRRRQLPYAMHPQLFQLAHGKFQLTSADTHGDYFQQRSIGRSVVRLDWNDDGRPDLCVGHLETPYALLTNISTEPGHWLKLELIGTRSSRDAIGTIVTVHTSQGSQTTQLTAGDGYMASNQRQLQFGLGPVNSIERIEIQWPSGQSQILQHISANTTLQVVEPRAAQ